MSESNLAHNRALVRELSKTQSHMAAIVRPDPKLEKVHNLSLAMEQIRANADSLGIKASLLPPDKSQNVYHLIDTRIVSECLDAYNKRSGDSYQRDRESFCIAQRAMK